MTWTLTASGSSADADSEELLIADLRQVLATDDVGAGTATLATSFHGTVDLLAEAAEDGPADDTLSEGDPDGGY